MGRQVWCYKHNESREIESNGTYGVRYRCRSCVRERCARARRYDPRPSLLRAAKSRADKKGIPFNITMADIRVPKYCPVLGIELQMGGRNATSPSLDRIIPELGYVAGNVVVMSLKANRMKNDGTINEHAALLNWMVANFCLDKSSGTR